MGLMNRTSLVTAPAAVSAPVTGCLSWLAVCAGSAREAGA
jgi:hypothetical protein